jgi:4-alpha-glucanotransferase
VLLTVTSETVPGLSQSQYKEISEAANLPALRSAAINYPIVKKLKLDLLLAGFAKFVSESAASAAEKEDFEEFKNDNKEWLEDYVLFRTLVAEHKGDACWTSWDVAFQNPAAALNYLRQSPKRDSFSYSCQFWSFVQWLAARQWQAVKAYAEARGVSLMGDIPFGVSRFSADVWANQHLFDLTWCGGAPPEKFFQGDEFTRNWGQNWGIPVYNWPTQKTEGYAWWRRRIAQTVRYCHYFRIDHVLGFFRLYSFPWLPERDRDFACLSKEEAQALAGGRLPKFLPRDDYPTALGLLNKADGQKLLTMVIEAAGTAGIVAEDLGVVPDYVRPLLKELGIPGFTIPMFERQPDQTFTPKEVYSPLSLCTYGTHDHEPLAKYYENLVQWWHGQDGDNGWREVRRLMIFLGLDPESPPTEYTQTLQFAFFKTLLQSPCWLAVFIITDLLGTKQRFNEPGLSGDYNWSQRLDRPLSQYETDHQYADKIRYLKNLIMETDRAPSQAGQRLK